MEKEYQLQSKQGIPELCRGLDISLILEISSIIVWKHTLVHQIFASRQSGKMLLLENVNGEIRIKGGINKWLYHLIGKVNIHALGHVMKLDHLKRCLDQFVAADAKPG